MRGSQTLEQAAVTLKLPWRIQDDTDARAIWIHANENYYYGNNQHVSVCC